MTVSVEQNPATLSSISPIHFFILLSSGNDNKWVSAGKLKYFKNSIVQIKRYVGSGNVYLGYKRILNFDHLPKIVMFIPNISSNLYNFKGLKTLNVSGRTGGRVTRNLKDVFTEDIEYIKYSLQRNSDNRYKEFYAQKVTFNTETSNIELEVVDMDSTKEEISNNSNNLNELYENPDREYIYIGLF